ncbi:Uncharacterised protein [Legionella wadsworthii]|uniref:Uncharacterized protein n=1 Tax=Legionella wadsworthii TaxID=28088 RepID=A0A378LSG3_9GAMM|nr:hypothetical protein [Legionella wadsworthii]STY29905.1 Uncharacterised protein [Legionella wadsworthii]
MFNKEKQTIREESVEQKVNPNQDAALQMQIVQARKHIDAHRNVDSEGAYPESVLAVFDLIDILNNIQGEIKPKNNEARKQMALDLKDQVYIFLNAIDNGKFSAEYNDQDEKHRNARDAFLTNCGAIINEHYKQMAADPTIWNAIKGKMNDVCKFFGLKPDGKFVDTRLDASSVLKNQSVKERFDQVKNSITIKDEDDFDYKGPGM